MITLTEAKAHLVVEHTDDDTLITALIAAVSDYVESYTGRAITERAAESLVLDGFCDPIELPVVPVQSVTSVQYNDTDDAQQTLAASGYRVDGRKLKTEIRLAYGADWPNTTAAPESVTVTYVAGYPAGQEPELLKRAALLLLGSLYEQRDNHITGVSINAVPMSAEILMQSYVVPVIA